MEALADVTFDVEYDRAIFFPFRASGSMGSAWNSACDRSRLYCFNGLQWFFAVARVWTSALGSDACLSYREVSRGAAILSGNVVYTLASGSHCAGYRLVDSGYGECGSLFSGRAWGDGRRPILIRNIVCDSADGLMGSEMVL